MIDAAKFADLALLLIDGSYGFEMVRKIHLILIFSFYPFHSIGSDFKRTLFLTETRPFFNFKDQ
jgi:hypothetical protein